jgi:hypothetical protein
MKRFAVFLILLLLLPSLVSAFTWSSAAEKTLEQMLDASGKISVFSVNGRATAPALSPANQGRIYYDTGTQTFLASVNGGAYATFGGDGVLASTDLTDSTNLARLNANNTFAPPSGTTKFNASALYFYEADGTTELMRITNNGFSTDTYIGWQAGRDAVGATASTFIGHAAGASNTTGGINTAVGDNVFILNTTGSNNAAFGSHALGSNITGSGGSAFGISALGNNTASNNSAFGVNAGLLNTSGTGLAFFGANAGLLSTGSDNTAFGFTAGAANTTGSQNIWLGSGAGNTGTTATLSNTITIGYNAIATRNNGVVIGNATNLALWQDPANFNIMIGLTAYPTTNSQAGGGILGQANVGIGYHALHAATTGFWNLALGAQALSALTTGGQNTAIGTQAMAAATSANLNVGIGTAALGGVTTGQYNTAIGFGAGQTFTTGNFNTAVGALALNLISGATSSNTAFGTFAGQMATTGGNNTLVGYLAGGVVTSGGNNTILGYSVGSTVLTTGARNILIGISDAVTTPAAGTNDYLNIGATLIGDLAGKHFGHTGAVPAVSNTSANSCGTTAATIVGTDQAGKVTVGATTGTSCTVTFATAFANAPPCVVNNETTANLARATSTTTAVILAGTFVAGDVLSYACNAYF